MSKENPLWGAPRIHGELLKLGFEIAESTVSKYMIQCRGPPSQTWRTFLRNHAEDRGSSLRGPNSDIRVPDCVCWATVDDRCSGSGAAFLSAGQVHPDLRHLDVSPSERT
jgi:hypothetical protein